MQTTTLLVSVLAATILAVPTYPELNMNAAMPGELDNIRDYFNMLASKVRASQDMSVAQIWDVSKITMPSVSPTSLPPPSPGLTLKHVAIGRGTQNYTCDVTGPMATPVPIGAKATLFNTTYLAVTNPDLLDLPLKVALALDLGPDIAPANSGISGRHFFLATGIPFFDLNTPAMQLGEAHCVGNNSVPAPLDAPRGRFGEAAVAWLKLLTKDGTTGNLKEVYRLKTAGGSPPETCWRMPASFERQYAAQYWFYES